MYKRVALNGLAVLGLLAGASAYAERAPGFYVGAGLGQATLGVDGADFDESDTSFKVFGGYNFNNWFGAEVTYFDGGSPGQTYSNGVMTGSIDAELTGLNLSAVGRLPLSEMFSIFGRIGYTAYDWEVTGRINNQTFFSESASENDLTYGIGLGLAFGQFELRGEYEGMDIEDGDYSTLAVSGLYRF